MQGHFVIIQIYSNEPKITYKYNNKFVITKHALLILIHLFTCEREEVQDWEKGMGLGNWAGGKSQLTVISLHKLSFYFITIIVIISFL